MDINLKVKEKGKQSISFSGGVSGIAGSFVGLLLSDQQFPGAGRNADAFGADRRHSEAASSSDSPSLICSTGRFRPDSRFSTTKFDYNTARQEGILLGQQVAINPALQENYNTDSKGFTIFASYPLRKLFVHAPRADLRMVDHEHHALQPVGHAAFRTHEVHQPGRPLGAEWHPAEQDHADAHLQHGGQPGQPDARQKLLLRVELRGRPAGRQRQHDQQHLQMTYFHPNYHRRNTIALNFAAA